MIQDEKALALNTEEGTCFLFHRAVPELALKSKHWCSFSMVLSAMFAIEKKLVKAKHAKNNLSLIQTNK